MLNAESIDFVFGLITGWIEGQVDKKEGESSDNSGNLLPPLSYSLLQPHREHAGRLKGTTLNFCMPLIRSTLHPGFHLNRKMIR
jgi:hypothetical protein